MVRKIEVHTMYSLPVMFFFFGTLARALAFHQCESLFSHLQPYVWVVDNKKQHFQIQIRTGNGE